MDYFDKLLIFSLGPAKRQPKAVEESSNGYSDDDDCDVDFVAPSEASSSSSDGEGDVERCKNSQGYYFLTFKYLEQ